MNRKATNDKFRPASLRRTGTARTVLLRMAADQERAERIRALKEERPDLTWRRIGDHVGVSERAASEWKNTGGIEYENAKKLAELFEVEVDYIWRGSDTDTPSPFAGQDATAALTGALGEVLDAINAQLANQTRVLEEIKGYAADAKRMLEEQRELKTETDEVQRLARELIAGREEGPSETQPVPRRRAGDAKKRAAKSRTP